MTIGDIIRKMDTVEVSSIFSKIERELIKMSLTKTWTIDHQQKAHGIRVEARQK